MDLPSTKPYLIRAIHQWCCDNGFTPYLAVAVDSRTRVPREHVRDGQIVLNVGYDATAHLSMDNDGISFQARFGGVARDISIPIGNISAIYARENGAGMAFEPESNETPGGTSSAPDPGDQPEPPTPPTGRARLQRVK
ncbi:MAG: ClpXP protease specificity-enhancing factor [Candidatus Accumulibacter sp.]|uniref:ClpXP protease specificity-enhancing factor n=1 Tax=Candidatus Accumulibacter affinis TaxID=2954384 RepID=A0A935T7P2_9PROT|nr:ClpXP protease specificity-enhancing factor [Candidatus Accumulibacter affinis]